MPPYVSFYLSSRETGRPDVASLFSGDAQRQFSRLYEMLLLYKLEAPSKKATDAEFRSYRLFLKERLYRFNYVRPDSHSPSLFLHSFSLSLSLSRPSDQQN